MYKVQMFNLFCITLFVVTMTSCANQSSPEGTVKLMYKSISENDTDTYIDTILPENRLQPNIFGLMSAISISMGFVSIDLAKITDISIKDLKVSTIEKRENYALVRAEGKIRYPILALELRFCDQHDVRYLNDDGKWYVDMYAPERVARLEKILGIKQQELQAMSANPSLQANFLGSYMASLESVLNLCR